MNTQENRLKLFDQNNFQSLIHSNNKLRSEFNDAIFASDETEKNASAFVNSNIRIIEEIVNTSVRLATKESDFSKYKQLCNLYGHWESIKRSFCNAANFPKFPRYSPTNKGFLRQFSDRTYEGIALRDSLDKTTKMFYEVRDKDARTGKIIRYTKTLLIHDENNSVKAGDKIIAAETSPISKRKHATLLFIQKRNNNLDPHM